MIKTIIAVALTFILISAQVCTPSATLDQMSTGTYTFSLQSYTTRLQCFNVTLDSFYVNSIPQIAIGISGIANFQNNLSGLDYSLRSSLSSSNSQLSLVLIVNNGSWGSVTVSYLISSRPQFILGNALSNGNLLSSCTKQQTYSLTFNLPTTQVIPNSQSLGILILLSGIRTPSTLFTLQFTQPSLDLTLNQINTSVITNATNQIQLIQIYYVIIDLAQFASNGYAYNFTLNSVPSDYSLSGVVAVNSQSLQYAFFAVNRTARLTCVGFNCSACQTSTSCTSLGGQVTSSQCIKCTSNQVFVNGACACSSGLNFINGICQTCPQGTLYNALLSICSSICITNQVWLNGACQCAQGYTLVNGQCQQLKCASNLFYYLGGCYSCPANSTASSDQTGCVCLPGYTYVSSNSSCMLASTSTSSTTLTPTISSTSTSPSTSTSTATSSTSNGIYLLPSGTQTTTSTTTTTTTTNTGSTNVGTTIPLNTVTTFTSACPTGAYYSNLTCRSSANITIFQTAKLSGQNTVYVGITAYNLPDTLPNNSNSNLIVAQLTNSPANTNVSINASAFNIKQWVASINYTSLTTPITLVLSWNNVYSGYFTTSERSYALTTVIIPSQVTTYNLAITPTNSLSQNGDTLTNGPVDPKQISDILNSQE